MADENNSGRSFLIISGLVIGLIVIALLIGKFNQGSVDDIIDSEIYEYNGFSFSKSGSLWETMINKYTMINDTSAQVQEIPFFANYGPKEIENISYEGDLMQIINQTKKLILTFDPAFGSQISFAGIEIGKVLVSFYNWKSESVVVGINVEDESIGFPYADCNNATNGTKVINFNFANVTKIVKNDDCYNVFANKSRDIVKAADVIMYNLLGIMK